MNGPLVDDVELAVKGLFIGVRLIPLEEELTDLRFSGLGGLSQRGVVCGNFAPADDRQTLFGEDSLEDMAGAAPLGRFRRGKKHGYAIIPRLGEFESQR